jgi:hypothetical protein
MLNDKYKLSVLIKLTWAHCDIVDLTVQQTQKKATNRKNCVPTVHSPCAIFSVEENEFCLLGPAFPEQFVKNIYGLFVMNRFKK